MKKHVVGKREGNRACANLRMAIRTNQAAMEEACDKLVSYASYASCALEPPALSLTQLAEGDTEVFLVAVTEQIHSRQPALTPEAAANEVAGILLHEPYRVQLKWQTHTHSTQTSQPEFIVRLMLFRSEISEISICTI
jgi:hypothetical protein